MLRGDIIGLWRKRSSPHRALLRTCSRPGAPSGDQQSPPPSRKMDMLRWLCPKLGEKRSHLVPRDIIPLCRSHVRLRHCLKRDASQCGHCHLLAIRRRPGIRRRIVARPVLAARGRPRTPPPLSAGGAGTALPPVPHNLTAVASRNRSPRPPRRIYGR